MAAGRYNFTIEQGTTVDFEIDYTDANSNPVDLTNYQARMQFRPEKGSDTIYLTLSSSLNSDFTGLNLSGSGGGSASKPPTSGSIGVFVSSVTSSALDFPSAAYDLEIASGSGEFAIVTRLLEGVVILSKEVTEGPY